MTSGGGGRLKHAKPDDPAWLGGTPSIGEGPSAPVGSRQFTGRWQTPPTKKKTIVPYIVAAVVVLAAVGAFIALQSSDDKSAAAAAPDAGAADLAEEQPVDKPVDKPKDKPVVKPKDKPKDKPVVKPVDKPVVKPKDKPVVKPKDKPKDKGKGGKVTITLLVVPPSAKIVVGGKSVRGSITVPKSDVSLPVKVTATGYKTKTMNLVPSRDRELVIQLLPEPTIKPPPEDPKPKKPDPETKKPDPAPEKPVSPPAPTPAPEPAKE